MKMKPPMSAATRAYMASKKKIGSGAADNAGPGQHDAYPYGAATAVSNKKPFPGGAPRQVPGGSATPAAPLAAPGAQTRNRKPLPPKLAATYLAAKKKV